jgi:hypothetical protein
MMDLTYELPASTLSFGKLVSISIRERSRGKSKEGLLSERALPSVKRASHGSGPLFGFADPRCLHIRLDVHPMHVTPELSPPVEN